MWTDAVLLVYYWILPGNPGQSRNRLLLAVLMDKADPRRSQLCPLMDLLKMLLVTAGLENHTSSGCVYSLLEQNLPQSAVSVRTYGAKDRAVPWQTEHLRCPLLWNQKEPSGSAPFLGQDEGCLLCCVLPSANTADTRMLQGERVLVTSLLPSSYPAKYHFVS